MALPQRSHTELNPVQVSLLRLFNIPMSEEDTLQLKQVLVDHYSALLEQEINHVVIEKGYIQDDFDKMLNDPDQ
ncbi:hypothetical protein HQ865_02515 [Mucilaginibacter mali]|uniref:Uncharacterized protein n=1 Tax=Mucilaginibacter mali TaxID=2740462 RepID=A0A7D4UE70_9SPHI|nr:hypothetical protein [Mucilaginibacter mali]QKJ28676.1 hypothetical protein HQ865_02515 [Mucilaginibacter mali]